LIGRKLRTVQSDMNEVAQWKTHKDTDNFLLSR
jgi:hypothetical protein